MYLPIYIGEDKTKMNLGTAYNDIEECLEFVYELGYKERVANQSKMLYANNDGGHIEIAMLEVK